MACKDCNEIVKASCEEELCNGSVSLPCDEVIAAACIKNVTALPNLGACNDQQNDYACTDLQTVLLAIDGQLENCGSDIYLESGELDGTDLVLTLNDETEVTIDLSALSVTQLWTRNAGTTSIYPTTLTDKVGINTNIPQHKLDVNGTFGNNVVPALNEVCEIVNDDVTIASLSGVSGPFTADMSLLRYGTSTTSQSLLYTAKIIAALVFDSTTAVSTLAASNGLAAVRTSSTSAIYAGLQATNLQVLLESTDGVDTTELRLTKDNLIIDSNNGWSGTFTNGDGDTVTVTKGIITNVAP